MLYLRRVTFPRAKARFVYCCLMKCSETDVQLERSGYSHSGTPSGKIEIINGTAVYVALPTGDYDKTKALLFLTDVFGLELENNKVSTIPLDYFRPLAPIRPTDRIDK